MMQNCMSRNVTEGNESAGGGTGHRAVFTPSGPHSPALLCLYVQCTEGRSMGVLGISLDLGRDVPKMRQG